MKTEGTNQLLLTISALWRSSKPMQHIYIYIYIIYIYILQIATKECSRQKPRTVSNISVTIRWMKTFSYYYKYKITWNTYFLPSLTKLKLIIFIIDNSIKWKYDQFLPFTFSMPLLWEKIRVNSISKLSNDLSQRGYNTDEIRRVCHTYAAYVETSYACLSEYKFDFSRS